MNESRRWACWFGGGAAVAIALLACSGGSETQASPDASPPVVADLDGGADAPSNSYPAGHPAAPRVLKGSDAGTILTSPRIVPIVFSGDPMLATVTDFTAAVGASAYWHAAVGEYGIGDATAVAPIIVDPSEIGLADGGSTTTFSGADTKSFLAAHLDGMHADWGAPNAQTIYALFLPAGVTTDDTVQGHVSCTSFTGYHLATTVNGTKVAYVVVPRCSAIVGHEDLTGADELTGALSHEL
ncbi:MAG: hypothetical protein ABI183_13235, partial [Polyangiaceae bacterium]